MTPLLHRHTHNLQNVIKHLQRRCQGESYRKEGRRMTKTKVIYLEIVYFPRNQLTNYYFLW